MPLDAKNNLRSECKKNRDSLSTAERKTKSLEISSMIVALPEYKQASYLLAYNATGSEVDVSSVILDALAKDMKVALPGVLPRSRLRWNWISSLDDLVAGSFGIYEPKDDPSTTVDDCFLSGAESKSGIAIVPGVAFDSKGFRIGYGKGYYDRFLCNFLGTSIGVCFDCQLYTQLTGIESFDIPVNQVIYA